MAKYYLYQFQTLKVISLFDLVPDNSTELLSELIKNENLSIKIVKTDDLKGMKKIKTSRGAEDMKIVFFD